MDNPNTIITFNYDRVLEVLGLQDRVVLPGFGGEPSGLKVLKLHGSVNWRYDRGGSISLDDRNSFTAMCDASELAIAAPGPGKDEQAGRFEDLWNEARAALLEAQRVVFLGYRLPPTDSRSTELFVDALPLSHRFDVDVVLGQNVSAPYVQGLGAFLQMARPTATVHLLPTVAQHYLHAWDPAR